MTASAPSIVNRGVHLHPLSLNYAPTKALVGASLKGYSLHCIIFGTATEPAMENDNLWRYTVDIFPHNTKIPWIYSHGRARAKITI